VRRKSRDSPMR